MKGHSKGTSIYIYSDSIRSRNCIEEFGLNFLFDSKKLKKKLSVSFDFSD